ncbi:MAG: hypothetical protein JXA96_11580 [Sedimentisphaerales bacterium]|nr:hypothetical protein [Sedimentisphaerales bacterium]
MFNLDEKIIKWRDSLRKSKSLETKDIDELEGHLRDEINELSGSKLSEQEVFLIATRRLGQTDILADEYAKVNTGARTINRISFGITVILMYMIATYFAKYVAEICIWLVISNGITNYVTLGYIGFSAETLTVIIMLMSSYIFYNILKKESAFETWINRLCTRLTMLIYLLMFVVIIVYYQMAFHIPIPGMRTMDIQTQIDMALSYTRLLWSVLLPAFLMIYLIFLNGKSKKVKIE